MKTLFLLTVLIAVAPIRLLSATEFKCELRYTLPEEKTDFLFLDEGIYLLREDGATQVIYDKDTACRDAFPFEKSEYELVHDFKWINSQTHRFLLEGQSVAKKINSNYKFVWHFMRLGYNENKNRGLFSCGSGSGRSGVSLFLKNCSEI